MYEIFDRLMKERGLKASDVAKATGIKSSTLTDWKKGRYQPKVDKLQLIADYFGVTLDYLQNGEEPDFNDTFFNGMYFEAYLKCIGWNTTHEENGIYTISNGSVSVNVTSEQFERFEAEMRNRCIEGIMGFISASIGDQHIQEEAKSQVS